MELIRAVTRQRIICHGRGIFTPGKKFTPGKLLLHFLLVGRNCFDHSFCLFVLFIKHGATSLVTCPEPVFVNLWRSPGIMPSINPMQQIDLGICVRRRQFSETLNNEYKFCIFSMFLQYFVCVSLVTQKGHP